ncbi:MAG: PEP-CTERM sorting domain-containing protein [Pseudomonadota bacterium]|nr:PEP-CTERM sorting domain-containing protein [Pseudomonadota bacterium]
MRNKVFRFAIPALSLLGFSGHANAILVDFEDVLPFTAAPFTSQGVNFSATGPNVVFPPGANSGAGNGTNTFGWCGSFCGGVQVITASLPGGTPFSLQSIDAGNLSDAGEPLGFRPGMMLEVLGNLSGGGTVSQSLTIIEDVMTTFTLMGFNNLVSVEFTAPAVATGNPDPNIDNLLIEPFAVPEPGTLGLAVLGAMGIGWRARNRRFNF